LKKQQYKNIVIDLFGLSLKPYLAFCAYGQGFKNKLFKTSKIKDF